MKKTIFRENIRNGNITFCCMDCGGKIGIISAFYSYGRCGSCSAKARLSFPENNPRWKGGISLRNDYLCENCQKSIGFFTALYGSGFCKSCINSLNFKGKNNPAWKGGISKLPYTLEFTDKLKLKIRQRDNFICQNCEKTEELELKDLNQVLSIHHIDYNKDNCLENNLITTCCCCNAKANANIDYWFAFYTYKIEETYGS